MPGPAISLRPDAVTIHWEGTERALWDAVEQLPSGPSCRDVILDCSAVETLQSEQLGALIHIRRWLQDRNCRLHVCDLTPAAIEVLHLTRLDRMLDIQTP